ncbi:hypothetical protein KO525_00650 [Psychrosphaera sp. B3R10]|uniref:hypothetical protein n=1 Tax=unclassified Psychrosphaera TaxID=2641570 RepID=UPI001C0A450F|nr:MULTISPECIES: hypothetical protein [unclassified Psychrosphaera]MBU2881904.1 hypothetical protein [Psychrosphaera sp. I2R16]MBU2987895.1 hypothetical protein [Psychrosphaera sp. B3R10]
MPVPDSVIEEITSAAKEAWPEDKEMQTYTVKEELDAYRNFVALDYSCISDEEKETLIQEAKESFESWEERFSSIQDELEAIVELKELSNGNQGNDLYNQWVLEAQSENDNYFRGQLEYIQNKASSYEAIQRTRAEIDPLKNILIDIENIIGSECYNGNIQNYGSWGELESEGRSFRYPVKFYDGENEYKRRTVPRDIPAEQLISGYYPFGANELNIYRVLHKVLKYLEAEHGLKLPKT